MNNVAAIRGIAALIVLSLITALAALFSAPRMAVAKQKPPPGSHCVNVVSQTSKVPVVKTTFCIPDIPVER